MSATPSNQTEQFGSPHEPREAPGWLELVRRQVDSLRFGQVQITVHEGRVAQVEITQRIRLEASRSPRGEH